MAMTITEKILARAAGKGSVAPGDLIMAKLDFCFGNDVTAPVAIDEFEKAGFDRVFDPDKIVVIPDHFTPNKDIKSAGLVKQMR
ncbi:MAG: 3-isopropylmalate dehydratase large subunit, partial [Actinobacteria bacterium]|nr:3-isopropylmalate dehydratase large subunit [Actinomycetota bacterium]